MRKAKKETIDLHAGEGETLVSPSPQFAMGAWGLVQHKLQTSASTNFSMGVIQLMGFRGDQNYI